MHWPPGKALREILPEALINRRVLKVGPCTFGQTETFPDVDTSLLQASSNPVKSLVWIRTTQALPIVQKSLHKRSGHERSLVDTFLLKQLVIWFPLRDFGHSTSMKPFCFEAWDPKGFSTR
jgi:hypothetical protein